MAITATERTQIIELVTLMFNAAPGATYLSQIVSLYEANGHNLQTLAEQLGTTSAFQSLNPNFQTAEEFASSFLTPLGLQGDTVAHDFVVSRFNAGVSKADIMYQGFVALTSLGSGASSQYTNALAILTNKETVAEYYSVTAGGSATDLSTLQNVLSGVTADASTVTQAENVINGTAGGGQTFALTTNIDNLMGTSGNDTFIGSIDTTSSPNVMTLNALDTINGGGGTNSLLVNIAGWGSSDISIGAGLVTNVQNLTLNSTDNHFEYSVYLNDNAFSNITFVNPYDTSVYGIQEGASVTQQGTAVAGANEGEVYGNYYFDPTNATSVTMNDTVTGSGTSYYNEAYFYHGSSSADGNLANATTIVANLTGSNANIISNDGEVDAYQYIYADNAGNAGANITVNLTASNNASQDGSTYSDVETYVYQTGDAHVTANINLTNSADTWTEVDAQENSTASMTAKAANNTANITLNNVSGTAGDTGVGAYGFDTVNIAVTGAAQLDDGLFFNEYNSTATAANSQTVTINAGASLTSVETMLDAYGSTKTVVTGSGAVDLGKYYASGSSTLSSTGTVITSMIDASGTSGGFKVDVKNAINSVAGGSGNDTIYVENVSTAGSTALGGLTLDGGAGTDTLGLNVADWATIAGLSTTDLAKITNFEVLALHGALTTGTYDVSTISGITSFSALSGVATANTATVTNLGANATVTLSGDLVTNNGGLDLVMKTDTTADTLNLILKPTGFTDNNDTTANNNVVTELLDTSNVETLNVTSTGKITAPTSPVTGYKADYITNSLSLTDNQLKTLVVSGDTSLQFTASAAQTALTSVDASANTAKHGVSIDMHLDTKAVTMLGSTGNDVLIGTAKADTINGGAGNDTITGGNGGDTMTGGAGNDTFVYTAVTESTLLNLDTIGDFSANTWGQGVDSTTLQPNGSATSAGADPTSSKINGDLINIHAIDQTFDTVDGAHTAIKVSVQSNAADAQTFLQNMAADSTLTNTTGAALDSSSGRLYMDFNHDGTVDSVIQLTGVTTLTSSAFVV